MGPLPSITQVHGGLWTPGGCELVATCYASAMYGGLCADAIAAEMARRYNAHDALLAACEAADRALGTFDEDYENIARAKLHDAIALAKGE